MPTDITRITELIKSFKSETREESVTVQVLGNLLQQIANVIGTTAQQTELTPVSKFYANLTSLNRILTGISAGTDDPNQMHLTLYDCSLKTGEITSLRDALVLRAATTDRAGVMQSQHVQDLNQCKNVAQKIPAIQRVIRSLQANYNTLSSMKQTETIHIECQIRKDGLYILGAQQLIKSGLKPILFRYSIRTSRHGRKTDKTPRTPMAKRRGWHRFFDSEKINVAPNGQILFRDDSKDADPLKPTYQPTPQQLFTYIKKEIDPATNLISAVKLPYGQKVYDILQRTHYFKFAIAFYKPISKSEAFTFSDLRTNLAIFKVRAIANQYNGGTLDTTIQLSR